MSYETICTDEGCYARYGKDDWYDIDGTPVDEEKTEKLEKAYVHYHTYLSWT